MKASLTTVASTLRIGASLERRKIALGPLVIAACFGTGVQEGRGEDGARGTVAVYAQLCGHFAVGIWGRTGILWLGLDEDPNGLCYLWLSCRIWCPEVTARRNASICLRMKD